MSTKSIDQKFSAHLHLAQSYWNAFLQPDDHVIDATCGNGYDTLYLAQKVPKGKVYAFDIQEIALKNTSQLLKEHQMEDRVLLFHSSHENFSLIPSQKIRLIVYNLGYLPRGDKRITTQASSSKSSVQQALVLCQKSKGAISIMCYPGHEEGKKEQADLLQELEKQNAKKWQVAHHQWINRANAPCLFWVQAI